jgi:hypothetical protein
MSFSFVKLFSSITESTVWCEPQATRCVWITMLAKADRKGRFFGSIPGLANLSRVSLEECQKALDTFLSPDKYSRTPDNEGRRIEPIDGGWRLLNYDKFRAIRDEETVKESKRNYINKRRAAERAGVENVENVDHGRPLSIQAEAEAEAEADKKKEINKERKKEKPLAVRPVCVSQELWDSFLKVRRAKKAPLTTIAFAGIEREAKKAAMTLTEALTLCCEKNWSGFNAEWVAKSGSSGSDSDPWKGAI